MPDIEYDPELDKPQLNRTALVGLVGSVLIAVAALFILPTLTDMGLSFLTAFWVLCGVELVCAVGVALGALNLHTYD